MRRSGGRLLLLASAACAAALACGGDDDGEIVVSAASSLTEAMTEVAAAFEEAEGVGVALNFASSAALAAQIAEGAPADVFASADEAQMQAVEAAGRVDEPLVFATNRLAIAVPAGSEAVRSLQDLATSGLRLVLAGPEVPAGAYTLLALERAEVDFGEDFTERVLSNVVSYEANVRGVLTKVQLGEADAGVVYETDLAAGADEVDGVRIPEPYNVQAVYLIAAVEGSEQPGAAGAFVDFVLSDAGQAILRRHGFGPPP